MPLNSRNNKSIPGVEEQRPDATRLFLEEALYNAESTPREAMNRVRKSLARSDPDPNLQKTVSREAEEGYGFSAAQVRNFLDCIDCAEPGQAEQLKDMLLEDKGLRDMWLKFRTAQENRLLTRDEVNFVESLKETGGLHKIHASYELASTSIHPEQLREAIDDITQYTDSVQKQLDAQLSHMSRNLAALRTGEIWVEQRSTTEETKRVDLQETKKALEQLVADRGASIKSRAEMLENIIRAKPSNSAATEIFDTHISSSNTYGEPFRYDHLLSKLQDLGWELRHGSGADNKVIKLARHYASEEVFMLVQACRTSLNTAFAEACHSHFKKAPQINDYKRAVEAEMVAIIDEIQSLWDEVVPVAHMAVEKQLLEPILRRMDLSIRTTETHQSVIFDYICGCLQFMNERLQILAQRLGVVIYHHQSLFIALQHAKAAGAKSPTQKMEAHKISIDSSNSSCSTGKVHMTEAPMKQDKDGCHSPMALIKRSMETFGAVPLIVDKPLEALPRQITKLNEFVQHRAAKGDDAFIKVHKLFEAAVKAGLNDNELGNHMVMDCIVADSLVDYNHRGAAFADSQTEVCIDTFVEEKVEIGRLLDKLKLPGLRLVDGVPNSPINLWPMMKNVLQTFEKEQGINCYKPESKASPSCPKCIDTMKLVDMVRKWGDLPEFKQASGASGLKGY